MVVIALFVLGLGALLYGSIRPVNKFSAWCEIVAMPLVAAAGLGILLTAPRCAPLEWVPLWMVGGISLVIAGALGVFIIPYRGIDDL